MESRRAATYQTLWHRCFVWGRQVLLQGQHNAVCYNCGQDHVLKWSKSVKEQIHRLLLIQTQTLSLKQYINTPELNMTNWKINHKLFKDTFWTSTVSWCSIVYLSNQCKRQHYIWGHFLSISCLYSVGLSWPKEKKELLSIILWYHISAMRQYCKDDYWYLNTIRFLISNHP